MIQILLATYNGAQYLAEQLESLLAQSYADWSVLIHDDGSNDQTLEIVQDYCLRYPDRFCLLKDCICFGNSRDNFAHLLEASTSDYVMFCDQDDVWLPDKISKTFEEMLRSEALYGSDLPIVVHSDLQVVSESLNTIAGSLFSYQGLQRRCTGVTQVLAKNSVTGCTMMLNRRAQDVSLPIPKYAVMHDWWIAAKVLQAGGRIQWIEEPLILYRQHGGNAIGAKRKGILHLVRRPLDYKGNIRVWKQAKEIDPSLNCLRFFLVKLALSIRSLFK